MEPSLLLKPDLSTLKDVPWLKKEALVIGDVLNASDSQMFKYSSRNILKDLLK